MKHSFLTRWRPLVLILCLAALASCAPSRFVRPLEEKQLAVSASFGGPFFKNFGVPLPTPHVTAAVGYGLKEDLTVFGGMNFLALGFKNLQLDLGLTKSFRRPEGWKPGFSISPALNPIFGTRESVFRIWPSIDANAWWEYGKRNNFAYAGLYSWFDLTKSRPHEQPQPYRILPGMQLGHVFAGNKWEFTTEFRWNSFAINNQDWTADWVGIGNLGAVSAMIGITKKFGK